MKESHFERNDTLEMYSHPVAILKLQLIATQCHLNNTMQRT